VPRLGQHLPREAPAPRTHKRTSICRQWDRGLKTDTLKSNEPGLRELRTPPGNATEPNDGVFVPRSFSRSSGASRTTKFQPRSRASRRARSISSSTIRAFAA
jgi:hypothetical protein